MTYNKGYNRMSKTILQQISGPSDLKALPPEQLPQLFAEIREELIETVTKNGGHLASNLGVVELTVAMHRVFDSPQDHFIFDVGHQSYVHKLLTGRQERFSTLRQPGGLSGFTKRCESEHDPFGCGHSSTSLSAGIGFAYADRARGANNKTVVVIGDGAFTGGMIHEALNNVSRNLPLVIILNENEMSISPTTGEFREHLSKIRSSASYFNAKQRTTSILQHIPLVGAPLFRGTHALKRSLKNLVYHSNYFEDLGIRYFGPVDGTDYDRLELLLTEAKKSNRCALVHVLTKKGSGYAPAEQDPGLYHALPPEIYYHNPPKGSHSAAGGFSALFGKAMGHIMERDMSVVAITAAMADGTGLAEVQKRFPSRVVDVGIAEEHALTFAAGLRAAGMKPVFAVYSSFLQRGYDNLIHDIALQNLPVTVCIDRCGLNAGDGVTHHGIFDVSMLIPMPNMALYAPISGEMLTAQLTRSLTAAQPTAIRYSKSGPSPALIDRFYAGADPLQTVKCWGDADAEIAIITYGEIASQALSAAEQLQSAKRRCCVILLEQLLPLGDVIGQVLPFLPAELRQIICLEEGVMGGGYFVNFCEELSRRRPIPRHTVLAIRDPFAPSEAGKTLLQQHQIDAAAVIRAATDHA